MMRISYWNLHFSFCNFQFSMKFTDSFQNAKLVQSPKVCVSGPEWSFPDCCPCFPSPGSSFWISGISLLGAEDLPHLDRNLQAMSISRQRTEEGNIGLQMARMLDPPSGIIYEGGRYEEIVALCFLLDVVRDRIGFRAGQNGHHL